ncbi:MAG: 4Fe-4S dicluster domain-containing protein [Dehalococcoidia bacterium]
MSSTETKSETATAAIAAEIKEKLIPIYIMGHKYEVPETLTIMKAMEYAGYKFIRGCGCRDGKCGACSTVYRKPGDYHIYNALACQTQVEPEMYLTQIPFYPANRAIYNYEELTPTPEEIFKLYPELFRCVACNACTKICPKDVPVMDVVSYLKQGNITKAAELSFDCIQCGLCASRCIGELPQYHIFQLARRIYGGKIAPKAKHLADAVKAIKDGEYDEMLHELMNTDEKELRKIYEERELEPEITGEDWRPKDRKFLLEVES